MLRSTTSSLATTNGSLRCVDTLSEGYEERFRGEFEGGISSAKINTFLQAPGDVSPF